MLYAQFFHKDLAGNVAEACGDRSVIVLDGRWSAQHVREIADAECLKRGYIAWQIFRGETFCRSVSVSSVNYPTIDKPVRDPVWLSAHGM